MYLGNDLQVAFPTYRAIDDISASFNGVTTSFALLVGGVAPVPQPLNAYQCLISIAGVVQKPDPTGSSGFNISGGNIVFSSAPTFGQSFFGVILAGADYVNVGANFPSGTAAVPSITFDSDLDTGIYNSAANQVSIATSGTERLRIDSAGQIEAVSLGTAAAPAFSFTTDPNTGIYSPGADSVAISTNGSQRVTVNSSGNMGIGATTVNAKLQVTEGSSGALLNNDADGIFIENNGNTGITIGSSTTGNGSIRFADSGSANAGLIFYDHTNNFLRIDTNDNERLRIDSSGRLLVGTSTYDGNGIAVFQGNTSSSTGAGAIDIRLGTTRPTAADTPIGYLRFMSTSQTSSNNHYANIAAFSDGTSTSDTDIPGRLVFSTTADGASSPTERMRITNVGDCRFGTTNANPTTNNVSGVIIGADVSGSLVGYVGVSRMGGPPMGVNRGTNDGDLVEFRQDGTLEGTISVSGTTVSYNGAHLSRWSQIPGIDPHDKTDRPEILRGTVMSNLDEMCDWIDPDSGDAQDNEQLNKTKISDVEGDKNVAGVFQSWDDDDDTWVNDYFLAMTGDFVIRIAAGVTVERGDLLMSAGDGTAKPQADDAVRSCTIAKVISATVSCTHHDGSYCVPCVLMAC